MGNCLHALSSSSKEKTKVVVYNEGEKEFESSTPVKKITCGPYEGWKLMHLSLPYSPLPPSGKLEPGEVYYLVPPTLQPHGHLISMKMATQDSCKRRTVKIVLTRQQMELLYRNVKAFRSRVVSVGFSESFTREDQKWRPSLPTIPEVRDF